LPRFPVKSCFMTTGWGTAIFRWRRAAACAVAALRLGCAFRVLAFSSLPPHPAFPSPGSNRRRSRPVRCPIQVRAVKPRAVLPASGRSAAAAPSGRPAFRLPLDPKPSRPPATPPGGAPARPCLLSRRASKDGCRRSMSGCSGASSLSARRPARQDDSRGSQARTRPCAAAGILSCMSAFGGLVRVRRCPLRAGTDREVLVCSRRGLRIDGRVVTSKIAEPDFFSI